MATGWVIRFNDDSDRGAGIHQLQRIKPTAGLK